MCGFFCVHRSPEHCANTQTSTGYLFKQFFKLAFYLDWIPPAVHIRAVDGCAAAEPTDATLCFNGNLHKNNSEKLTETTTRRRTMNNATKIQIPCTISKLLNRLVLVSCLRCCEINKKKSHRICRYFLVFFDVQENFRVSLSTAERNFCLI